jgi:hypothetical protein
MSTRIQYYSSAKGNYVANFTYFLSAQSLICSEVITGRDADVSCDDQIR